MDVHSSGCIRHDVTLSEGDAQWREQEVKWAENHACELGSQQNMTEGGNCSHGTFAKQIAVAKVAATLKMKWSQQDSIVSEPSLKSGGLLRRTC